MAQRVKYKSSTTRKYSVVVFFMKTILFLFFLSLSASASPHFPDSLEPAGIGEIEQTPDGRPLKMSQYEAVRYCQQKGKRLPTIRELALLSQSLGAKGIRETAYPESSTKNQLVQDEIARMKKDGYDEVVYKKGRRGSVKVDFYFNSTGFPNFGSPLGYGWFWASSIGPSFNMCYFLNSNGTLGFYYPSDENHVRCTQ